MNINIERKEKNININYKQLILFEKKLGIKLTDDYRSFLAEYNGGFPEYDSFYTNENEGYNICTSQYRVDEVGILCFYPLNEIKMYKKDNRIPKEFLPIASDSGNSSHICLGIEGIYYGKIYFWGYGDYMLPNNNYSNIYYMTDSFTSLIDRLEECKD